MPTHGWIWLGVASRALPLRYVKRGADEQSQGLLLWMLSDTKLCVLQAAGPSSEEASVTRGWRPYLEASSTIR